MTYWWCSLQAHCVCVVCWDMSEVCFHFSQWVPTDPRSSFNNPKDLTFSPEVARFQFSNFSVDREANNNNDKLSASKEALTCLNFWPNVISGDRNSSKCKVHKKTNYSFECCRGGTCPKLIRQHQVYRTLLNIWTWSCTNQYIHINNSVAWTLNIEKSIVSFYFLGGFMTPTPLVSLVTYDFFIQKAPNFNYCMPNTKQHTQNKRSSRWTRPRTFAFGTFIASDIFVSANLNDLIHQVAMTLC